LTAGILLKKLLTDCAIAVKFNVNILLTVKICLEIAKSIQQNPAWVGSDNAPIFPREAFQRRVA